METENIEIGEKYLPIGTVVMLKGGKKRAMITGFCSIPKEDQNKVYDYSGCIYPEGFISSDVICLFNHEQIEKVYFKGYIDEEEIEFKSRLNDMIDELLEKRNSNDNIENINTNIQQQSSNMSNETSIASQAPIMPE